MDILSKIGSGAQGATLEQGNKEAKRLKFVDLFCGCGGMSLGLQMAGMEGLASVEFDAMACKTYRKNFDHTVVEGDITLDSTKQKLYDAIGGREVDVVCGGFPCQGFSTSGKRIADDPRNRLFYEFVEVVRRVRPKVVIGENVNGILTMQKGEVVKTIIREFESLGYSMDVKVLKAADYGVPQLRERVIFIGNRIGAFNWYPEPRLSANQYVSVREAIGDLVGKSESIELSHVFTKHGAEMKARMAAQKEGEGLYENRKDSCRKLFWDKPSLTVKDNHGNCFVHPIENRSLTAREMARLQSFPDWFNFSEVAAKYQLRQIGNAVPPLMAETIGEEVMRMIATFGAHEQHSA